MIGIKISQGRVIDPANQLDAITDVYIQDKKIVGIDSPPNGFSADKIIDATDKIVCPGLIDTNARLREPGSEHKADLGTESKAAVKNGITTLCCPPDTNPVMDTPAVATMIFRRAQRIGKARILPIGAATKQLEGKQLSNMHSLMETHCIALSNANTPYKNALIARRVMDYARTFDFPLILRPMDTSLADDGCAHDGKVATMLGLSGIPEVAETVALAQYLALISETDCRCHFEGISSAKSVYMLEKSMKEGLPITASVPIHQLHLSEIDVDGFNANCHVYPPLRTDQDKNTLRQAVNTGTISVICSDHQPHEPDAKQNPFPATEPGMSGLDTLLSLTLKLVHDKAISMNTAISCLTAGPAAAFNLPFGNLSIGNTADLCIFDPNHYQELKEEDIISQGKNSAFIGWDLPGLVTHTLCKGKIVHEL